MTACNLTIENTSLCTLETCCLDQAQVSYIPTIPGNAVYMGAFALLLLTQTTLGVRYKTWGFLGAFGPGILLEVLGYAGRIWLAENIFANDPFLMYLITLTIAPAFLSAGIYLCLGRIVQVYGAEHSRIRPGTYTLIFIPCDLLALVLQAAGGAIASIAETKSLNDIGVKIMIAGLAWQVASLALFMGACFDLLYRVRRSPNRSKISPDNGLRSLRSKRRFQGFLWSLGAATILIMIRSIYRVIELSGGFNGHLANDEVTFMIFEGPMIILAILVLTIWHPGVAFGGLWNSANFRFRGSPSEIGPVSRGDQMSSSEEGFTHVAVDLGHIGKN